MEGGLRRELHRMAGRQNRVQKMEPRVHFYLDRAISGQRVKELLRDPAQRKEIETLIKERPLQIWASLTFLRNDRLKVYTGERIPQYYWDADRQRVNTTRYRQSAHDFNAWLNRIEDEVLTEIRSRYRFGSEPPTRESILALFTRIVKGASEKQTGGKAILAHMKAYTEENKPDWTEGFYKIVLSNLEHIVAFEQRRKKPLTAGEDYVEVWREFKDYLTTENLKSSTANKHLKIFRRLVRALVKAEILPPVDFDGFKRFEEEEAFHIALRESEIKKIAALKLTEPHLERSRDLQLLQIWTGQRVGDLPQVVKQLKDSNGSLTVLQGKGNKRVTIPVFPALKKHIQLIRKKYPDGLPLVSEQKFNEHIKSIAELAGLTQTHTYKEIRGGEPVTVSKSRYQLVSTHTNRRTFCTLCVARGISDKSIMAITGHKSHKVFLGYVRVDDNSVSEEFNAKFK